MCGRFVRASTPAALAAWLTVEEVVDGDVIPPPSWNVAPTEPVYAAVEEDGRRLLRAFRWGLGRGGRLINARAETLRERPAFHSGVRRRRCIVPADGFYEWPAKRPVYITARDGSPLAFAGLWNRTPSCAIVTTEPNAIVAPVHDRMPVILPREVWAEWLDPDNHDVADLIALLVPADDDLLDIRPVGTAVNDVRNKGPELVAPVVEPPTLPLS